VTGLTGASQSVSITQTDHAEVARLRLPAGKYLINVTMNLHNTADRVTHVLCFPPGAEFNGQDGAREALGVFPEDHNDTLAFTFPLDRATEQDIRILCVASGSASAQYINMTALQVETLTRQPSQQ
jgi:hypothetical protein